jgi:hypothetical protein
MQYLHIVINTVVGKTFSGERSVSYGKSFMCEVMKWSYVLLDRLEIE